MFQLVYTSVATTAFTADLLRKLLVGARANNTGLGVSGMLLHVEGSFLQVLEGERAVVDALYVKIGTDRRHARVSVLVSREVTERNFPDWSMGFVDATAKAASTVGYRAGVGFADLAGDADKVMKIIADFRDGRWRARAA
ncbi:hypothetical protein BH11MYX2_BH11MYX2_07760 [soil metagenome]